MALLSGITAGFKNGTETIKKGGKGPADLLVRDTGAVFFTVPPRSGNSPRFVALALLNLVLSHRTTPPWMASMKKFLLWLTALLAAVGLGVLAPGPASAASYCGLDWGSLAKTVPGLSAASVTNVRTGRQPCFDRMVVDLNGRAKGYIVRYVPEIIQDGTGYTIPVCGKARLQVVVNPPSYDSNGNVTYNPAAKAELSNVAGYQTFRQGVYAGSFEGSTSIGLGVHARLPFRVFTVDGPGHGSRLIVDVAHSW
jgi:hypothetical protein